MAKISVIMPFNRQDRFLIEAIDSVINQTFTDFDFYLINDSAMPLHKDLLEKLKSIDKVILIPTTGNIGAAEARNLALKKINDGIIFFLDSDDIWTDDHILLIKEKIKVGDIIYTRAEIIDEKSQVIKKLFPRKINHPIDLLAHNDVVFSSVAIYLRANDVIIMENKKIAHDLRLYLTLMKRGYYLTHVNRRTVFYRKHGSSLSSKKLDSARYVLQLINEQEINYAKRVFVFCKYIFNGIKKHVF